MAGEAIRKLPTLAEMSAIRRAQPKKPAPIAKLDRSVAKAKSDSKDARALAAWALSVKNRDKWIDRYTGEPVKRARQVGVQHPDAGHAHHVVSRTDAAVRTDRRNGLCVAYATHLKLEANELKVVGTKYFTKNGKRYLNCDDRSTKVVPA